MNYTLSIKNTFLWMLCLLISGFVSADTAVNDLSDFESRWYAKQFNVTLQEAKRRHHLSSTASKIANVFDIEKSLFAGMIIKNDPPYKILFEVKHFADCDEIKYTPLFDKDKRCNIYTRIKKKLQAAKIAKQVDIVFVKHAKLDQENFQRKAEYYANKYAKNEWSTIGWSSLNHRVEIGVLHKEKFENRLLAANIFLPPEIFVIEVKRLLFLH